MKKLIFFALCSSVFFISCNNIDHSKEIKKIDSLYTVIDSIEGKIIKADTAKIRTVFNEYLNNIGLIKENFNDKKDDSIWKVITTYGIIRKPIKDFLKKYPDYYDEIKFSRKQLDSLKTDLKNDKIPENKISEYTKTEADAVNSLMQQVTVSTDVVNARLQLFDSLNPKVINVIKKLKKIDKKKISVNTKLEGEDD
ncbi:MAG: hypothetical protein HGB12_15180 [Bacteroidetes bacterium]|nr:hypothetical protein [Bacteroidota bacterium]